MQSITIITLYVKFQNILIFQLFSSFVSYLRSKIEYLPSPSKQSSCCTTSGYL